MEKADYVIGAGDKLTIRVWKNPELSVGVPVRPDGKISVPLLDDVQAEGFTAIELKEVITRDLSEYVTNPDVTVVVEQINKAVYVLGEVGRKGPILLASDLRVTDAISAAGGFGTFADKKRVKVIRRSENGEVEYRFNYDAYVAGKAPGTNLLLVPGRHHRGAGLGDGGSMNAYRWSIIVGLLLLPLASSAQELNLGVDVTGAWEHRDRSSSVETPDEYTFRIQPTRISGRPRRRSPVGAPLPAILRAVRRGQRAQRLDPSGQRQAELADQSHHAPGGCPIVSVYFRYGEPLQRGGHHGRGG